MKDKGFIGFLLIFITFGSLLAILIHNKEMRFYYSTIAVSFGAGYFFCIVFSYTYDIIYTKYIMKKWKDEL